MRETQTCEILLLSLYSKGCFPRAHFFGTRGTNFGCVMHVIAVYVRVIYINGMGMHMHIVDVDTHANKICVRRAKVPARGRLAYLVRVVTLCI